MDRTRGNEGQAWTPTEKIALLCAPGLYYLITYYAYRLFPSIGLGPLAGKISDRPFVVALVAVAISPFLTLGAAVIAISAHRRSQLRGTRVALIWMLIAFSAYAFVHFLRFILLVGVRMY